MDTEGRKTPAQLFNYIFGSILVAVGLLGFAVDTAFDTGGSIDGDKLLGIFEVNGTHNLIHIATGLLLLLTAPKRATAKLGATVFGVAYALVTLIGLIDGQTVLGLIPVNPADNVLHIALTALALFVGLTSSGDDRHTGRRADETATEVGPAARARDTASRTR